MHGDDGYDGGHYGDDVDDEDADADGREATSNTNDADVDGSDEGGDDDDGDDSDVCCRSSSCLVLAHDSIVFKVWLLSLLHF